MDSSFLNLAQIDVSHIALSLISLPYAHVCKGRSRSLLIPGLGLLQIWLVRFVSPFYSFCLGYGFDPHYFSSIPLFSRLSFWFWLYFFDSLCSRLQFWFYGYLSCFSISSNLISMNRDLSFALQLGKKSRVPHQGQWIILLVPCLYF